MLNNTCEADVDNNKAKEHLSMAEEIRNDILNLEVNISFLSCMIYCPLLVLKKNCSCNVLTENSKDDCTLLSCTCTSCGKTAGGASIL